MYLLNWIIFKIFFGKNIIFYDYEIEIKLISKALKTYLKEDIEKESNAFIKLWKKNNKKFNLRLFYCHFLLLYYKYLNKFIFP